MKRNPVTTSKRLIHNTFFNVLALMINSVIGFFLIGFFLGQIGETKYGIWVLVGSIFRYRGIMNMGLNSAVNRYVPIYLAKNDEKGIERVVSTSLFFLSISTFVLIAATLVIYCNIGSWFAIKSELVQITGTLVLIVGFCAACAMPLQISSAVLSGLQRYDIVNIATLVPLFLRTILLVIFLLHGYGLVTMGLIFAISEIVIRLLQAVFARRLLPNISISLTSINLRFLREMLTYGINTFLYTMAALILFKASDIVIGIFLGTAEISWFAVATAAVLLLSQFLQAFTAAIKPAVSDLDARDEHLRVREASFLMQKYSLLLIVPAGFFLFTLGRQFLCVWIGDKFQDPAIIDTMAFILSILTVGHCLRLAQHSNFLVLVGRGEHKIFGILTLAMALLCVLGSIIAVRVFGAGLIGIAWANFIPMVIIFGVVIPVYFNRKMNISFSENLREVWWPALLGSLPTVIFITILKYKSPPTTWAGIAVVVLSAIILTALCSWFFSLTDLERKRFRRVLLPGS